MGRGPLLLWESGVPGCGRILGCARGSHSWIGSSVLGVESQSRLRFRVWHEGFEL